VVFDIDDTLSESRARTLVVAKEWDQANGTHHFDRWWWRRSGRTARDGEGAQPARPGRQGLPGALDLEFWKGESFVHDTPIAPM